ncbi:hypothetical protein D1610_10085 [Sphingomonas gilva]|uniref:Uncharacterized protein n=1 Tax=Sphingomonas gilva TaxID=2305907 RepID=A0A396RTQ0_9SPHN|nr:hypothetical protein [Sphingomonas gilva]RHW17763.1 hypothetical protein D1610_10085 [Sphingomonas gilva]
MSYFSRFSPLRAYRDLRLFLSYRSKHELWFGIAAIVITGTILAGFVVDSRMPRPYKREIIYFDNWPANRTDAEIIAKQKVDQAAREKQKAENDRILAERRAKFKKVDDALESWGL